MTEKVPPAEFVKAMQQYLTPSLLGGVIYVTVQIHSAYTETFDQLQKLTDSNQQLLELHRQWYQHNVQ